MNSNQIVNKWNKNWALYSFAQKERRKKKNVFPLLCLCHFLLLIIQTFRCRRRHHHHHHHHRRSRRLRFQQQQPPVGPPLFFHSLLHSIRRSPWTLPCPLGGERTQHARPPGSSSFPRRRRRKFIRAQRGIEEAASGEWREMSCALSPAGRPTFFIFFFL